MNYLIIIIVTLFFSSAIQATDYFSTKLCESGEYDCIQAKPGDTWTKLIPDAVQRDRLQRFNRMNTPLKPGMYVAIPENFENSTIMSLSPFPFKITPPGKKLVAVDLSILAWGAYDAEGNLLKWGPASGGRKWCYDIKESGKTVDGRFTIYDVRGRKCFSKQFPINKEGGGAPMPYSMFFKDGFALHGSDEVPGFNASHGCVRIFVSDAKWLNEQFVKAPGQVDVMVMPYDE